jgi:adenine specific DNA methylase Mod
MNNQLWFGDNLTILREQIADSSVDLVYLDPPFNSKANYNVLFKTPGDEAASAQVEAFRDTWSWGEEAQWAYDEIMRTGGGVASIINALHGALGESDMMAYLVMMAQRLYHLRRVLKPNGALYLHCDPTASHYLKVVLDGIFRPTQFRSEIIWKRTSSHNSARRWGPIHDVILFYAAGDTPKWNNLRSDYNEDYVKRYYKYVDKDNRRYRVSDLTGSGTRNGQSGSAWRGYDPNASGRHWAIPTVTKEELGVSVSGTHAWLDAIDEAGLFEEVGGWPHVRRFLDTAEGQAFQDIIDDVPPLSARHAERRGYPTQKPAMLLDRIIRSSSDVGDVVLDPFCGCGTTVAAAQAAGRKWIGIDVAYHAIKVIEERLAEMPGEPKYSLGGIPRDFESAIRLAERDRYQFQWWANYLVGVQALKEIRKGPDKGIDGEMYFMNGPRGWGRILTSVKSGVHVGAKDVREFKAVIERERADMGLFICLREPTREMKTEAAGFGFVESVHGHFPRLQIVSIDRWFHGDRPSVPSLGHLSREYFRPSSKPSSGKKAKKADPTAPEFPFTFLGDKKESIVVHFNPIAVSRSQ